MSYVPWMRPYIDAFGDAVIEEYRHRQQHPVNGISHIGAPHIQKHVAKAKLPRLGEQRARQVAQAIMVRADAAEEPGKPKAMCSDLQEVLAHKKAVFERALRKAPKEIVVELPDTPIGVLVFGDPHLDSDGCDIELLQQHVKLVQEVDGLYGALIGDLLNNWTGRLVREYAHQSCNLDEAMMLLRWLLDSVPWLFSVLGNHDRWNNGAQLYELLLERANVKVSDEFDVRLALTVDGHTPVRLWAKHAFKGRSMYHNVHGLLRALREHDYPADVYLQGHNHTWGVMQGERDGGRVFTVAQVGTYKRIDPYALSLGYTPDTTGQALLLVIDPRQEGLARVRPFFDVGLGVQVLQALRA